MPYKWKGDALAKLLILGLILILLINGGIVIGFQLMTDYTCESREELLSAYPDYNILDRNVTSELSVYLLAAPAKENRLILSEKHFLFNRHRLLLDEEVQRHYSADVKADLGTVSIRLEGASRISGFSFRPTSLPLRISTLTLRIPLGFVLWNLALLAVEGIVCILFHKIRNS
nr:hypothetical protein [Oscillospiraceae bacterium]